MRNVFEMNGPRSRSLTNSVSIFLMPAAMSFSMIVFVSSSLALASSSPLRRVDDVVREDLALEVVRRHLELFDLGLLELADVLHRDPAVLLDDDLAADLDVEAGRLTAQPFGNELELDLVAAELELVLLEEHDRGSARS